MAEVLETPKSSVGTNHRYRVGPGRALPFGATITPLGINFAVFSSRARSCTLVLFERGAAQPFAEIPFPDDYRIGHVFNMIVFDLDPHRLEYGYRMDGVFDPKTGHRFDANRLLLDPYGKSITGRDTWGKRAKGRYPHRTRIVDEFFDWGNDRSLNIPIEDLVIYEMHVRSFTKHRSSGARHPGTFDALREKIPYLQYLGINAVELMPVFDFDELENLRVNVDTGEQLGNVWGYSTISFFALKGGLAAATGHGEIAEFKTLIKSLHEAGIEAILDVVYNHTAEGNEQGPTHSFRGIDNKTYYMLTPDGYYFNFAGTGNTLNCNHPAVSTLILDSLRYWVTEFHIDGFRFDLASILTRDENGRPMADPPLVRMIAGDPVLARTKLIAEPWDAGGLYHVGAFPSYGRWAEWNGRYRDTMRRFLKGDRGLVADVAQRVQGSPDLYPARGPIASINFFTAHDGFTLADLVSYNQKHNEANLEGNRDGSNDNQSWNCGVEGPTDDPAVNALRLRQMKNAFVILMCSQGTPMFMMGDEAARTQHGNNNAYCQDNDISWFDWSLIGQNIELFNFVRLCIAFRRAHPVLRNGHHFRHIDYNKAGIADVSWHGSKAWYVDWDDEDNCFLAFLLSGEHAKGGLFTDDDIYVAMNMCHRDTEITVPNLPKGKHWFVFASTSVTPPHDIHEPGQEPPLHAPNNRLKMKGRSVLVLVGK